MSSQSGVDKFTGKPYDWPHDAYPALNGLICEHCGDECINRCPQCGAPQCCPRCCNEATRELERLSQHTQEQGKGE